MLDKDINKIKSLYSKWHKTKDIAKSFWVHYNTIYRILNNQSTWLKWISKTVYDKYWIRSKDSEYKKYYIREHRAFVLKNKIEEQRISLINK